MKLRYKLIPVIALILAFSAVVVLPRIIEAKRAKAATAEPIASYPLASPVQGRKQEVTTGVSIRNDTSPPLREMKQLPIGGKEKREANENPKIPHFHKDAPDRVVQKTLAADALTSPNMPTADANYPGIQFPGVSCNCAPPDTNGEAGLTQYVQSVNEGFQVFDKTTGASLLGPSGIQTLWSGFGGVCEFNGAGDPVVLYDQLADRWVVSQFAVGGTPYTQRVGVSTSPDPTGT